MRNPNPGRDHYPAARTAKTSTMKSALTTRHSAAVVPGAPAPRMNDTSAATAAAPRSSIGSAPWSKITCYKVMRAHLGWFAALLVPADSVNRGQTPAPCNVGAT